MKTLIRTLLILLLSLLLHADKEVIRDIAYGEGLAQRLDLFLPAGKVEGRGALRPAAIVLHGGGWHSGSRSETEHIANYFARKGFVVANVDYSLAPGTWPAQMFDAAESVWWIKGHAKEYAIDTKRVLVVGISAGGHIAASLAQISIKHPHDESLDSSVHGVVSFWGPWDLTKPILGGFDLVSGLLRVDTQKARRDASPLSNLHKKSPPTLMLHGTHDRVVPFEDAKTACNVLVENGLECTLVPLQSMGHKWPRDSRHIVKATDEYLKTWRR